MHTSDGSNKQVRTLHHISELLEEIDMLNKLIDSHDKADEVLQSVKTQYQYLRGKFVNELQNALKSFQLVIQLETPHASKKANVRKNKPLSSVPNNPEVSSLG